MDRPVILLAAVTMAFPALVLYWPAAPQAQHSAPRPATALPAVHAHGETTGRRPRSASPPPERFPPPPPAPPNPKVAAPSPVLSLTELAELAARLGPDVAGRRCPDHVDRLEQTVAHAEDAGKLWQKAVVMLASCRWAMGDEGGAERSLHAAIHRDPLQAEWREHLAAYYRHQGRYAEAIALLESALRIDERAITHRLLATVHQRYAASEDLHQRDHRQHLHASEEHLLRAAELRGDDDTALVIDIARTRLRRGEHLDAAYLFERGLMAAANAGHADIPELMREAADAWMRAGQPALAHAYIDQAVQYAQRVAD